MEKKSSTRQTAEKQAAPSQSKNASKPAVSAKKNKSDAGANASHSRAASETGKKS